MIVTPSGICFIISLSVSSGASITLAPFAIASFIYSVPSFLKPFIAINISPGCTFLESFSMLGISNSISPLAFKFSNPANIDFNFINFSLFIYFFIVII